MSYLKVGIIALQGDVIEHIRMLKECGAETVEVRKPEDLEGCNGLIIPGGESTAISKLMNEYNLYSAIKAHCKKGMAIYGTCAGAILLANKIIGDKKIKSLNLMDISIHRNAYGRQAESFEHEIKIKGMQEKFNAVFIRAPVIEAVHDGVEILAEFKNKAVMAKKRNILISAFHPELTNDKRVHELFIRMCCQNQ